MAAQTAAYPSSSSGSGPASSTAAIRLSASGRPTFAGAPVSPIYRPYSRGVTDSTVRSSEEMTDGVRSLAKQIESAQMALHALAYPSAKAPSSFTPSSVGDGG